MLKIYYMTLDKLKDPASFAKCYNEMPDIRRQKIDRIRGEDGKRQSLGAGILFNQAFLNEGVNPLRASDILCGRYSCDDNEKNVETSIMYDPGDCTVDGTGSEITDAAKAAVVTEGEAPKTGINYQYGKSIEGRYISLSHSGNVAMCAISDQPVGCDVEQISDKDIKIAKRFLMKEQYLRYLRASDRKEQQEMFFKIWTAKECVIKAQGGNVDFSSDNILVDLNCAKATVQKTGDAYNIKFFEERPDLQYIFACCFIQNELDINMQEVCYDL